MSLGPKVSSAAVHLSSSSLTKSFQPYYWPSMDFGHSPPLATRSGWMAIAILPFLVSASSINESIFCSPLSHQVVCQQVEHDHQSYRRLAREASGPSPVVRLDHVCVTTTPCFKDCQLT